VIASTRRRVGPARSIPSLEALTLYPLQPRTPRVTADATISNHVHTQQPTQHTQNTAELAVSPRHTNSFPLPQTAQEPTEYQSHNTASVKFAEPAPTADSPLTFSSFPSPPQTTVPTPSTSTQQSQISIQHVPPTPPSIPEPRKSIMRASISSTGRQTTEHLPRLPTAADSPRSTNPTHVQTSTSTSPTSPQASLPIPPNPKSLSAQELETQMRIQKLKEKYSKELKGVQKKDCILQ